MASVLHFATDDAEKAACGAKIFMCDEYTDDRRYVDCGRCKKTKQFANYDPARYNVDVWNYEGDVIERFRSVTADEIDDIRKDYEDDAAASIVVTDAAPAGH